MYQNKERACTGQRPAHRTSEQTLRCKGSRRLNLVAPSLLHPEVHGQAQRSVVFMTEVFPALANCLIITGYLVNRKQDYNSVFWEGFQETDKAQN